MKPIPQEDVLLQPLLPEPAPIGADDIRVGRRRVEGGHHGGEAVEHVGANAAARVGPVQVDVVVGRSDDQGLQSGRILHPHLPLHHAAVGHAPHPDVAAAPGLGGDPLHHFIGVPAFLIGIDVLCRAPGIPRAANVEVEDGIAALGEVGRPVPTVVVGRVRAGVLDLPQPAIGVVGHDGRKPALRVGPDDDGRQLHPVPHGDPDPPVQSHSILRRGHGSSSSQPVPSSLKNPCWNSPRGSDGTNPRSSMPQAGSAIEAEGMEEFRT